MPCNKPLTNKELRELLASYPDDAPVFYGRDRDLYEHQVTETVCDDWEHATVEHRDDGVYETPARGIAVQIGPRF
jgi:hypothetical protein